eukprot:scaffold175_cov414-Prasinococcus_capsulatus_cf.AAC.52
MSSAAAPFAHRKSAPRRGRRARRPRRWRTVAVQRVHPALAAEKIAPCPASEVSCSVGPPRRLSQLTTLCSPPPQYIRSPQPRGPSAASAAESRRAAGRPDRRRGASEAAPMGTGCHTRAPNGPESEKFQNRARRQALTVRWGAEAWRQSVACVPHTARAGHRFHSMGMKARQVERDVHSITVRASRP